MSLPQGGLPKKKPPACFRVLVGELGAVALPVHPPTPCLRELGTWLVEAFAASRLFDQVTRLGRACGHLEKVGGW